MGERPDVRRGAGVDRPDRDPPDRAAHPDAGRDLLDLEGEAGLVAGQGRLGQPPADEPVARLVVGDRRARRPTRTPDRRPRSTGGETGGIARKLRAADDQVGPRRRPAHAARNARDLARDRAGRRHRGSGSRRRRRRGACRKPARSAAPLPWFGRCSMTVAPRRPRTFGGPVGRAVVDDEDRQVAARRLDHGPDPGRLVEAGDQGDDHAERDARAPPPLADARPSPRPRPTIRQCSTPAAAEPGLDVVEPLRRRSRRAARRTSADRGRA